MPVTLDAPFSIVGATGAARTAAVSHLSASGKAQPVHFSDVIEGIGKVGDGLGVGVVAIGFSIAAVLAVRDQRSEPAVDVYRLARQRLGRSILLGLEILVASDIIRTVAIAPTLTSVGVLAIIVIIRSVLSLSLQVELEGRWPWQTERTNPARS